ncbi:MAG: glycosyltransferase family 2 protein [bacterium]|nr:glycosyltransferase family 2 protein [bacterium]
MESTKLAVVIPCYNEQEVLPYTLDTLEQVILRLIAEKKISEESYLFFVDDGSRDNSWEIITTASQIRKINIKGVKFTTNYGNQSAILAGLNEVRKRGADAVLTIDADLQQDVNKIEEFVKYYEEGCDIVAGVRNDRKTDGFIKKIFSSFFYTFINWLGVRIKPNHSEYRLISKKTLGIIGYYTERNIFLRGLFHELGLKTKYVNFDVKPREHGQSKFSFMSLFALAMSGIVAFSTYPLRLVFFIGISISMISFIVAALIFFEQILKVNLIFDITFFKIWITFISGLQILCIGIIGEYIGQILTEVKGRPQYIIAEEL